MSAFFQSVTLRTAGFETIPQASFSNPTQMVSMLLMFIGGSPCGTAGGVKTVTFAVLFLSIYSNVRDHNDTEVFRRRITEDIIRKAVTVISVGFFALMISIVSLLLVMPEAEILDIIFEMTSAIATVGLSRGLTGYLTTGGKFIVILTMLAGRIGPISMALSLNISVRNKKKGRQLPKEHIIVG